MDTIIKIVTRLWWKTPVPLKRLVDDFRSGLLARDKRIKEPSLLDQFPWTSPNVWEMIVVHYRSKTAPRIFEYGTGASSIWHIRNLLAMGGAYVGVEHDTDWYVRVISAVLELGVKQQLNFTYEGLSKGEGGYDAHFVFRVSDQIQCGVSLKLRPPAQFSENQERFAEYVHAITEPCDVIIVDGRARKACVNYILDNGLLKPNGLLVLMEAGRGKEGWLGYPALKGESDYQPEVNRMLALGGSMVDGNGLNRWPGQKHRLTSVAYGYPCEACILVFEASNHK